MLLEDYKEPASQLQSLIFDHLSREVAGGGGTKLLTNYFGEEPLEVIDTKRSGRIPVILFCLRGTRAVEKTAKIAIFAASLLLTLSFLCVAPESFANNILQWREGWS